MVFVVTVWYKVDHSSVF